MFTATFEVQADVPVAISKKPSKDVVRILTELKDSVNSSFGYHEGYPAINSGPCGRFAQLFYHSWNERFDQKVHISFMMSPDSLECLHVLINLGDDRYYDGGNGIMKKNWMLKRYEEGCYLIEMKEYDEELLDEMAYGLIREYPRCPAYDDELLQTLINEHLDRLKTVRL